jgi:hypothetical protein
MKEEDKFWKEASFNVDLNEKERQLVKEAFNKDNDMDITEEYEYLKSYTVGKYERIMKDCNILPIFRDNGIFSNGLNTLLKCFIEDEKINKFINEKLNVDESNLVEAYNKYVNYIIHNAFVNVKITETGLHTSINISNY